MEKERSRGKRKVKSEGESQSQSQFREGARESARERGHGRHATATGITTDNVAATAPAQTSPTMTNASISPVTPRQRYGDLSNANADVNVDDVLPQSQGEVQSVKSGKFVSSATMSERQHQHQQQQQQQQHQQQGRFFHPTTNGTIASYPASGNDIHPLPSPQLAHLREAAAAAAASATRTKGGKDGRDGAAMSERSSLNENESDESSAYPRTSMSHHSGSGSSPNSRAGREHEGEREREREREAVRAGKDKKKEKEKVEEREREREKDRSVTPHSRHLAVPPPMGLSRSTSTTEKSHSHNRLRKAHKHSSMPPPAAVPLTRPSSPPTASPTTNHRDSVITTHSSTYSDSATVSTQAGSPTSTSRKTSSRRLLTKQRPSGNGNSHGHGDSHSHSHSQPQQPERPTHSREEGSLVIVESDLPNDRTQSSPVTQTQKAGVLSLDEDPFAKTGVQVLSSPSPSQAPSQKGSTRTRTSDGVSVRSSSSDVMSKRSDGIEMGMSPNGVGMGMDKENGRTPRRAREGRNQHQNQNHRQWRLGVSDEGDLGDGVDVEGDDDGGVIVGGDGYGGERTGSEDHSASIASGDISLSRSISNGHGYSSSAPSVVERRRSYRSGHGYEHGRLSTSTPYGASVSGSGSVSVSGSEDQRRSRSSRMRSLGSQEVLSSEVETVPEDDEDWSSYPLVKHLSEPSLLAALLNELSFPEWMALWSLSKEVRTMLEQVRELREEVLERYLGIVGYVRWRWEPQTPEPFRLTLKELAMYMRGVSTPPFDYAKTAAAALLPDEDKVPTQIEEERGLKKGARAYTRLVIRLREQAETEAEQVAAMRRVPSSPNGHSPVGGGGGAIVGSRRASAAGPPPAWGSVPPRRAFSRQSTRAPSPSYSIYAHGHNNAPREDLAPFLTGATFRSPLFRMRRAPLLRVFVPSAEGEWISDEGILECETELKKAGVMPFLRPGDVVWDMALGDEGNVGRLVWDGRYLIVRDIPVVVYQYHSRDSLKLSLKLMLWFCCSF